jgi:hypothetical protein
MDSKENRKWDFRLDAVPSDHSYSDDLPPEPLQPLDIPPAKPFISSDDSDSANTSLSSDHPPARNFILSDDSESFSPSASARRSTDLIRSLESTDDTIGDVPEIPPPPAVEFGSSEPTDSDSDQIPIHYTTLKQPPAGVSHRPIPPRQRKPSVKQQTLKTVNAIHHFFQGDYSIAVILQAIHGCAGDYKAAVVKLTQGFRGSPILEVPPTGPGNALPQAVQKYLRGR